MTTRKNEKKLRSPDNLDGCLSMFTAGLEGTVVITNRPAAFGKAQPLPNFSFSVNEARFLCKGLTVL